MTAIELKFAPNLDQALVSPDPPVIDIFKAMPNDISTKPWGLYVLVLEKPDHQAKLYVGTGKESAATSLPGRRDDIGVGACPMELCQSCLCPCLFRVG